MSKYTIEEVKPMTREERMRNAKGTWLVRKIHETYSNPYGVLNMWTCSVCGEEIGVFNHDNFCPNCGAEMLWRA